MSSLTRYVGGLPFAAGVTFCIGGIMAALISVSDLQLPEKAEAVSYEINPTVEDIDPFVKTEILEPNVVLTLPPPIIQDFAETDEPSLAPIITSYDTPKWSAPEITKANFPITIESDIQPILRSVPIMPLRAQRSGHCKVKLDVSSDGVPFNIRTTYCTSDIFERSTLKAVAKWKYRAAVKQGQSQTHIGLTNIVRYKLQDERGRLIPE